ncbi:squalene/phytoene synthase family protein [Aliiroseovarius crassostreae]|uniref:squalene/phytoene synthase family protein n=1 Tax=Aliiroseovarius crassostreae TaxID=154981 RepID=UPI00220673A1|nr:squalene/phytoene synthase family protein [Aliiroseovarius crassostreae]UWP90430.1 squalene/phytoene synthase family protein [Aliiroseovarius crassostreae]
MTAHEALNACAQMVQKGDPDRFLAAMTGRPDERARLFPLYAFNLEIARAPFMSNEPMVALVRLQFWRDVIEGKAVVAHEVATPLQELIAAGQLDRGLLEQMVDAREGDVDGIGRQGASSILAYAKATSGVLMAASADGDREGLVRFGTALGVSNWLNSLPELARVGRGHVPPSDEVIAELANAGLAELKAARRSLPRKGSGALRSGWRAEAILTRAKSSPDLATAGALGGSEFSRRARLLWLSALGRW